ncbi:MAG: tRNA uridine-5-carboxymethylaminomethyl(34) synthesis enzyme MnmG [Candidatus Muiribacteriota bacterium]
MKRQNKSKQYDVIVIGAGHAGCEAALSCAKIGVKTLLITLNMDAVALMPCNPSIGGPGKSHLVYEIDALGGEIGRNIQKTHIHIKTLNTSKGPAVQAVRAQADKKKYSLEMKYTLINTAGLDFIQAEVVDILVKNNRVTGIKTATDIIYESENIILTSGTYLKSEIVIGTKKYGGGPHNQMPSNLLSENLKKKGIKLCRFQTATPPRIKKNTVDFSKLKKIENDLDNSSLSFFEDKNSLEKFPTYLAYTNENTIKTLKKGLEYSPLILKNITEKGPRYCPSFDRKIMSFPEKKMHQIFVEPEGENTQEMYLQGLTSATPENIQQEVLQTIQGFENIEIMRPAYGIEYDMINSFQLKKTLETKKIGGLFTAGQINGTSGYEEAAAQGIVAGINAARKVKKLSAYIPDRTSSYIGVLIDDLISKEHYEPYRMFTSNAEYRLLLRQDNAVLRLSPLAYKLGLLSENDFLKVRQYRMKLHKTRKKLKNTNIEKNKKNDEILKKAGCKIKNTLKVWELLKRPEINIEVIEKITGSLCSDNKIQKILETETKYEGYIKKQYREAKRVKKMEKIKIPKELNFEHIKHISTEARENLKKFNPETFGDIKNIPGISSNDLNMIYIFIKNKKNQKRVHNTGKNHE